MTDEDYTCFRCGNTITNLAAITRAEPLCFSCDGYVSEYGRDRHERTSDSSPAKWWIDKWQSQGKAPSQSEAEKVLVDLLDSASGTPPPDETLDEFAKHLSPAMAQWKRAREIAEEDVKKCKADIAKRLSRFSQSTQFDIMLMAQKIWASQESTPESAYRCALDFAEFENEIRELVMRELALAPPCPPCPKCKTASDCYRISPGALEYSCRKCRINYP